MATETEPSRIPAKGSAREWLPGRAARPTPPEDLAPLGDGAVLERLVRMRSACQAMAADLATVRRRLRAVEAELRKAKQRQG